MQSNPPLPAVGICVSALDDRTSSNMAIRQTRQVNATAIARHRVPDMRLPELRPASRAFCLACTRSTGNSARLGQHIPIPRMALDEGGHELTLGHNPASLRAQAVEHTSD